MQVYIAPELETFFRYILILSPLASGSRQFGQQVFKETIRP